MPPKNSKKRQVSEPKKPVKPHGKPGGIQRTPLHAYDKAANQDLYNVQDIIAERQEKGVPKYLVRWEGFGPEDDTWEPIEHLAGAEEYIARFVEERNAAAKRSEEEHAAKRAKRRECAEQQSSQPADNDVPGGSRSEPGEPETIKRKTSWVWQAFDYLPPCDDKQKADKPRYKCLLSLDNGAKCDTVLVYCGGTTNMATHLRTRHSKYVLEHDMKSQTNTLKVDTDKNTLLMGNMAKWTPERRHLLCRKIAYWLVKRNRPLTLVERDTELRDVFLELSGGRFDGCSHHEIQKHLLQMVAVGTKCLKQQISDLVHDGLQLALAADLWSDGTDCALLGVFLYWIDKEWVMHEEMAGCVPFHGMRHTGENIRKETEALMKSLDTTLDSVFARVCDNGSNMKKALEVLKGLFCSAHTLERSVLVYTESPGVKETIGRTKAITSFFHRSPLAMAEMLKIQVTNSNPGTSTHKPPSTGNATRWHFTHDALNWYRMHQQTVQMFDVTNWGGEGYKEHKLDYDDWQAIQQTVAVLDPSAKMTNLIEGTKYPTLPLVLPMITHVIHHAAKPYLSKPWDKRDTFDDFTPNVQFARAAFIADLRDRWVDNLSPDVRRLLVISTLLDPRFKSFDFPLHGGRVCALRLLRAEWRIWKGVGNVAIPPIIATSKVPVDCLSAFFSEDEAEAEATDSTDTEKYMAEDELEAYLVCPDEAKETDILMWWKTKSTWPKLQLMARQYLAVPATSAGVERLFSKASLAHGDLAKAMKEETLSFALFASYNYAPSMYEGFQM
jgi:hypothetical protein